jgi:hypothetical protein
MTGFCRVGIMLKHYKHQQHCKCPRCLEDNEDTSHVIQCSHPDALSLWSQSLDTLEHWMTQNHGHPELIKLILLGLRKWQFKEYIPYNYEILDPLLIKAYRSQRRLGWKLFIEGYWAKSGKCVNPNTSFKCIHKN